MKFINWYVHHDCICGDKIMNGYYVFEQYSIASVANDTVLTKSGINIQLINHDTYWKLSVLQLKLKQFE
jgi:hypothetical protein